MPMNPVRLHELDGRMSLKRRNRGADASGWNPGKFQLALIIVSKELFPYCTNKIPYFSLPTRLYGVAKLNQDFAVNILCRRQGGDRRRHRDHCAADRDYEQDCLLHSTPQDISASGGAPESCFAICDRLLALHRQGFIVRVAGRHWTPVAQLQCRHFDFSHCNRPQSLSGTAAQ